MEELARRILLFWFGAPPHSPRDAWFRKDPAFDAAVGREFGPAVLHALEGGWQAWDAEPQGALARILLLDQFTRNMHRDSPRAFAGDALALAAAQALVARGDDARLGPLERWFAYLPFEHAESWPAQERSLALFAQLAAETGSRRAARVGAEARGRHPPLRPLPAPQRAARTHVDARGDRVPGPAGLAVLTAPGPEEGKRPTAIVKTARALPFGFDCAVPLLRGTLRGERRTVGSPAQRVTARQSHA